jgi:hypothetical protein
MIYFLLILSTLSLWAAPTKFDLSLGMQGRTLPSFGAELYAEGGYNQKIWGKKEEPKDVLYGLIRPNLTVSTSAVINSIKGEIEVFPISILGFAVGRQYQNSNFDFPFMDCGVQVCEGEFIRNYAETKMVLGHAGWVAVGFFKYETLRGPDSSRPIADWRNVIVGEPGEDVQIEKKLIFGKQFSNKLVGVLLENVRFEGSGERKESYAAIYQQRNGDNNYMVGAGVLHTDQQPMGFVMYFRIHHVALPSLKLF